jgi:hypothetical protein
MIVVTAGRQSSLPRPSLKLIVSAMLWLTMLTTAGCDASSTSPKSSAPMPSFGEARVEKMKTNLTPEEMRELALPASETPGLSVDKAAAQNAAIGNNAYETGMNPARGLNTQRLFATPAGSDDERMERLEAAVQDLRDDFDQVSPAINRLVAIEQEIQGLVDQLKVLVEGDNANADTASIPPMSADALEDPAMTAAEAAAASPVLEPPLPPVAPLPITPDMTEQETARTVPTPLPVPQQQAVAPPAVNSSPPPAPVSDAALLALRVADHDKTTRVVFETNENLPYTVDVDPEKILIVTFKEGASQANLSAGLKSSLIKSADQTPQAQGGFIVAMPLSKMTKVVRQGVLPPDGTNSRYRIYIDLER